MDILNTFTEASDKLTKCVQMNISDSCANSNAVFDFEFRPFISINAWYNLAMALLNFALDAGISYGGNYLEYYQAMALNSLYCAGTNGFQIFINLVEAVWYIFAQVNAEYILAENFFKKTYPLMCTCKEATDVVSADMIKKLLGEPKNNWDFLGKCQPSN